MDNGQKSSSGSSTQEVNSGRGIRKSLFVLNAGKVTAHKMIENTFRKYSF